MTAETTDRTITLVSHAGARSSSPFERKFPLTDETTLVPLLDITRTSDRFGDELASPTTERWARHQDDGVLVGGPLVERLGDVEVDTDEAGNITVRFDGDMPDDGSCHGPHFVFTGDSMFTKKWMSGPLLVALHVSERRTGHWLHPTEKYATHRVVDPSEFLIASDAHPLEYRGFTYGFVGTEHGDALVEKSGETLTVHDESVLDVRGFLQHQVEREERTLRTTVENLRAVADRVEAFVADDASNRPSTYISADSTKLGRAVDQLHLLRLAIADLDGS